MKERLVYVDFIKAISIILVVYCHRPILEYNGVLDSITMMLCFAAVPCFFMCSGAVMFHKSFDLKKHLKSILTVYIVFAVWKVIYVLLYTPFVEVEYSKKDLVECVFFFGTIDGMGMGHLWFMAAYIAVLLVFPALYYTFHSENGKKLSIYLLIILFVFGQLRNSLSIIFELVCEALGRNVITIKDLGIVNPFGNYTNMMFYLLLGGVLAQVPKEKIVAKVRIAAVGLVILGAAGLMYIKYWQQGTLLWKNKTLTSGYVFTSTIVLTLGVWLLCYRCKENKVTGFLAKYVGRNTMGIFYMHMIAITFFQLYLYEEVKGYGTIGLNLVKTLIIVIATVLVTLLLRKIPAVKKLVQ